MRQYFTILVAFLALPALTGAAAAPAPSATVVATPEKEERTEELPAPVRYIDIATLPASVEVVEEEGSPGEVTFYKSYTTAVDSEGHATELPITTSKVTKLPRERVIIRGTQETVVAALSEKTLTLEAEKAAEAKRVEEATSRSVPNVAPEGVTTPAENKALVQATLSGDEYVCADRIIMKESGWRTDATNPSSGAYGLAQSWPGDKMASAGADWRTNGATQFRWMQGYVESRYGSFCGALDFHLANNYY